MVTPAAVNRDLAVLRTLFNYAIRMKKGTANPVTGVKLLPEHNIQMRVLSRQEEDAYLNATSQPLRDIATIMLETGMRPGEVFRLRNEDVDLGLGFLRVSMGNTLLARRAIPLTTRAKEILSFRIHQIRSEWLFPSRHSAEQPIK